MSILITLLIAIVILAAVIYIVSLLPIPQPWNRILIAILCLIGLLILLSKLGFAF